MSESQSLSSSALLSLSVGSIIRAVDTGQDTVGAWKPETAKETWLWYELNDKNLIILF